MAPSRVNRAGGCLFVDVRPINEPQFQGVRFFWTCLQNILIMERGRRAN